MAQSPFSIKVDQSQVKSLLGSYFFKEDLCINLKKLTEINLV
jgi:hypothetical protein